MKSYFPDPIGWARWRRNQPEYQYELKSFAEKLHSEFCRLSHEDQCMWYFESDWSKWSHKLWLDKAIDLKSSGAPENLILDIIRTFKGV